MVNGAIFLPGELKNTYKSDVNLRRGALPGRRRQAESITLGVQDYFFGFKKEGNQEAIQKFLSFLYRAGQLRGIPQGCGRLPAGHQVSRRGRCRSNPATGAVHRGPADRHLLPRRPGRLAGGAGSHPDRPSVPPVTGCGPAAVLDGIQAARQRSSAETLDRIARRTSVRGPCRQTGALALVLRRSHGAASVTDALATDETATGHVPRPARRSRPRMPEPRPAAVDRPGARCSSSVSSCGRRSRWSAPRSGHQHLRRHQRLRGPRQLPGAARQPRAAGILVRTLVWVVVVVSVTIVISLGLAQLLNARVPGSPVRALGAHRAVGCVGGHDRHDLAMDARRLLRPHQPPAPATWASSPARHRLAGQPDRSAVRLDDRGRDLRVVALHDVRHPGRAAVHPRRTSTRPPRVDGAGRLAHVPGHHAAAAAPGPAGGDHHQHDQRLQLVPDHLGDDQGRRARVPDGHDHDVHVQAGLPASRTSASRRRWPWSTSWSSWSSWCCTCAWWTGGNGRDG